MKNKTLSGGIRVKLFESPPPEFDPLAANLRQLRRFGFPPIPKDERLRTRYEMLVRRLAHKFRYVPPRFKVHKDTFHGPRKLSSTRSMPRSGPNWCGGVVHSVAPDSFQWVSGDFVIPNVSAPTDQRGYYSSHWVGIDGDGSSDVCQAGVTCNAERYTGSLNRDIHAWWEWYPDPEVEITSFQVEAGDLVSVLICTDSGKGSTGATVYLTNRTSGSFTSFGISAPAGTVLAGDSAEWISEAPTVHGTQDPNFLSDFGEVFYSSCQSGTVGAALSSGGTGDNLSIVNSGGTVLANSTLVSSTVVQCSYLGPVPS